MPQWICRTYSRSLPARAKHARSTLLRRRRAVAHSAARFLLIAPTPDVRDWPFYGQALSGDRLFDVSCLARMASGGTDLGIVAHELTTRQAALQAVARIADKLRADIAAIETEWPELAAREATP